jgi:hypothetical protein
MRRLTTFLVTIFIVPVLFSGAAVANIVIYDAAVDSFGIGEGDRVLTIDYLYIDDNAVVETGTDYPYGRIWLVLYDPRHYDIKDMMGEEDWFASHELARLELPGPSSDGRWADGDEIAFHNMGIYDWESDRFDSLFFRIYVEEPSDKYPVDTIMWGEVQEDDTYDLSLDFDNDYMSVHFRTTALPELTPTPEVTFEETWMEHNVNFGGYDGLEVHLKFQIDDYRANVGRVAAYLHYSHNDESVLCRVDDPSFATPSGFLTVQEDFTPIYPYTVFTDFSLFIPYAAFPISDDYIDYFANVEILDTEYNLLASGVTPVFSVMRPKD